jgi:hypothetical protein
MDMPMIVFWDGTPLSELSREKLEEIISEQIKQIEKLNQDICNRSIMHINDLARMRRAS